MGNISTILAALFCASAPLSSGALEESKTEVVQKQAQLGKEIVSAARASYAAGEYTDFLKNLDDSYHSADLSGLIQMRQAPVSIEEQSKWESKFLNLQQERNAALLGVLSEEDNSQLANQVRSLTTQVTTPQQEKGLSRLNSFISMAPGSGANEDENALIDLDLEYEYKLLHAQMPKSDLSPQTQKDLQIALRMEKMDKMVQASKSFKDASLKEAVSLAAASLDARMARNLDGVQLNRLVKSKQKPSNDSETKVFTIVSLYQEKFSDLMKETHQ